jgi:hypothetical protein
MLWLHLLFACLMAQQSSDPKDLAVVEGRVLGADGTPIRKASLTLQSSGAVNRERALSHTAQPPMRKGSSFLMESTLDGIRCRAIARAICARFTAARENSIPAPR